MMKKIYLLLLLCGMFGNFSQLSFAQVTFEAMSIKDAPQTELTQKIKMLDGVVAIQRLRCDVPRFSEKYAIDLTQQVCPEDPTKGTFSQRIYLLHAGYDRPTVMVTDGYTASFGLSPRYTEELSARYNANIVVIQHRYFETSTPQPTDWKYMKGRYAATDMHNINKMMRKLYSGKFIATGVSKGGQNTMIYNTYYPNDVDVWVPYVGPVCFSIEDGRHEPFLANIGPKEDRDRIYEFQCEVLRRRRDMVKLLDKHSKDNKFEFKGYDLDGILDLCVLEYSFALWQMSCELLSSIPSSNSSDEEMFKHLCDVNDPSYFANVDKTSPFYVQAAMELGYYGYDTKPFKGLLSIKSTKGYLKGVMMDPQFKDIKFNSELKKDIYSNLKKNDPKMIFIYGEYDPWTAVAPDIKLFKNKDNMKFYLCPAYDHKTRIRHFPEQTKNEIWSIIDKWME